MGLQVRAALLYALPLMHRGKAPYFSTLRRPACNLQHRRLTLLHAAGFSTLPSSSTPTTATTNSSPGMSDELREFLAAEKKIVTFNVKGEVFHASKLILAMRSPVFGRMLYGSSGEKKPEDIKTIEVDTDPAAFKLLLHYIDTDSSTDADDLDGDDIDDETVKHLLVVADKYAMEYIKMACERALSQRLKVKSVATTLALAHKHDCRHLKDACITFINSSDRHAVISSNGYAYLKKECLDIFVQLWEKSVKSRKNN